MSRARRALLYFKEYDITLFFKELIILIWYYSILNNILPLNEITHIESFLIFYPCHSLPLCYIDISTHHRFFFLSVFYPTFTIKLYIQNKNIIILFLSSISRKSANKVILNSSPSSLHLSLILSASLSYLEPLPSLSSLLVFFSASLLIVSTSFLPIHGKTNGDQFGFINHQTNKHRRL